MEHWIAENIGTIITLVLLIIGFAASYSKLQSSIADLKAEVDEVKREMEKMRGAGVPFVCPIHESRLNRIESEMRELKDSIASELLAIKALTSSNHDLILGLERRKRDVGT